jgi:hypothetical protein
MDSDDANELLKHLGAPYTDNEGQHHENIDEKISQKESNEFWNRGLSTDYELYLKSAHWIKLAETTKTQRPRCEGADCPLGRISRAKSRERFRHDLEVHHLNYGNLYHEQADDLQVLCFKCHKRKHEGTTEVI